jgi:hypothetical protein
MKIQDSQKPTQKKKKKRERSKVAKQQAILLKIQLQECQAKVHQTPKKKQTATTISKMQRTNFKASKEERARTITKACPLHQCIHPQECLSSPYCCLSLDLTGGWNLNRLCAFFFPLPGVLDLEGKLLGIARGNWSFQIHPCSKW